MHFYIMSQKYKGNFDQACQKLDTNIFKMSFLAIVMFSKNFFCCRHQNALLHHVTKV